MKITAVGILRSTADSLAADVGESDPHTIAARKAHADLVNLISWSEYALDCISASKYPNTHAELRLAVANVKGGAA
jgi:hypothetical protein